MRNLLLFTVMCSVIFVACNKNEKVIEGNSQGNFTSTFNAANSINQFDNVGVLHNNLLGKIMKKVKTRNGEELSFFKSAQEELNLPIQTIVEIEEMITLKNYKNDFKSSIEKYISDTEAQEVIVELFNKTRIKNEKGLYSNYEEFKKDIEATENRICLNSELSELSKQQILSLTSTFRHSAAYWCEYLETNEMQSRAKLKWWQWVIFGAADAIGGFAGGGAFSVGGATGASSLAYNVMK